MFPCVRTGFGILLSGLLVLCSAAQLPAQPRLKVKETARKVTSQSYKGVVEEVDADSLTLVVTDRGKVSRHEFVPIDLLRDGKTLPKVWGCYAYRWQDVQKGDTLDLMALKDDGDGKTYCLEICIQRRPGAELPKSQNPDKDYRYAGTRIFNAIDNGEDVSEEDIRKAFPPEARPSGGRFDPGGLIGSLYPYREKLEANRERIAKEKALKAKPADGKGEAKKDDKK